MEDYFTVTLIIVDSITSRPLMIEFSIRRVVIEDIVHVTCIVSIITFKSGISILNEELCLLFYAK